MRNQPLLTLLALTALLSIPVGTAAMIREEQLPGVTVHWPGSPARGQTMGIYRESFVGSSTLKLDERCGGSVSVGKEPAPREVFTIPAFHDGEKVVGSEITTDLEKAGGVLCLMIVDPDGSVIHRGLVGQWSTPGRFVPGEYTIWIGAPGRYRFSVEVELVAA